MFFKERILLGDEIYFKNGYISYYDITKYFDDGINIGFSGEFFYIDKELDYDWEYQDGKFEFTKRYVKVDFLGSIKDDIVTNTIYSENISSLNKWGENIDLIKYEIEKIVKECKDFKMISNNTKDMKWEDLILQ